MNRPDVYLLILHEPHTDRRHLVPINGLVVHARTLLHAALPQPDGVRIYRCLTGRLRKPDEIVPLSTLTYELGGGRLWPLIGDRVAVTKALVRLARDGRCDAMPLGLPDEAVALLTSGPQTRHGLVSAADSTTTWRRPLERQEQLDGLTTPLQRWTGDRPFWPGDDLSPAPTRRHRVGAIGFKDHALLTDSHAILPAQATSASASTSWSTT